MNRRRVATTLCIALTLVLCRVRCADAQAVSAGPYYATPSWDQKLLSSTRFVVLSNWNSEAVLDRETGLVWEKAPGAPDYANQLNWSIAHYVCTAIKAVGNRREWRLPTVQELASLLDPASTGQSQAARRSSLHRQHAEHLLVGDVRGSDRRAACLGRAIRVRPGGRRQQGSDQQRVVRTGWAECGSAVSAHHDTTSNGRCSDSPGAYVPGRDQRRRGADCLGRAYVPGPTFTVPVEIIGAVDLVTWQFDLAFDPADVQAISVSEGPFTSENGQFLTLFIPGVIDNVNGLVSIVAGAYLDVPPGPSGNGVLAYVEFTLH